MCNHSRKQTIQQVSLLPISFNVIPAKAGIQAFQGFLDPGRRSAPFRDTGTG
jgi:hypothetical protein